MVLTDVMSLVDNVSTHSRLKAAGLNNEDGLFKMKLVSTHSRLKAAGDRKLSAVVYVCCFNTQPPEGGWGFHSDTLYYTIMFQHTAA